MSEYVLLLRKPQTDKSRSYADRPVVKQEGDYSLARWQVDAHAFWRSSGDGLLTPAEMMALRPDMLSRLFTADTVQRIYDYEHHVRIGEALEVRGRLPSDFMCLAPGSHDPNIWHDVLRMLTLNGAQQSAGREKHLCPLQFDIVDRLIRRYSEPGELVLDPFCGLGTVPLRALKLGRRGAGTELSPTYWLDSVKYLEAESEKRGLPSLFDALFPPLAAVRPDAA